MVRALAAYLLVFWLLGLVVHLGVIVYLFGAFALLLFVLDQLRANSESTPRDRGTGARAFRRQRLP